MIINAIRTNALRSPKPKPKNALPGKFVFTIRTNSLLTILPANKATTVIDNLKTHNLTISVSMNEKR